MRGSPEALCQRTSFQHASDAITQPLHYLGTSPARPLMKTPARLREGHPRYIQKPCPRSSHNLSIPARYYWDGENWNSLNFRIPLFWPTSVSCWPMSRTCSQIQKWPQLDLWGRSGNLELRCHCDHKSQQTCRHAAEQGAY